MINRYLIDKILTNLTYSPTPEQYILLEKLSRFILNPEVGSLFLLKGYAGTGKSSLMGGCVQTLNETGHKVILLAPTGRAAKVFANYAHHPALTIHKKIYRQKAYTGQYEDFSLAENLHKNTLFIVDEASMIPNTGGNFVIRGSGCLLNDLIEYVYSGEQCRLIIIGDDAQLPPVGETLSPALDKAELSLYGLDIIDYELKQVARQAEQSGILFNATRLRKSMELLPLPVPQIKKDGFQDIRFVQGEDLIETISTAYDKDGIGESIIITRSNKRSNIFNQGIRNQILYREEELTSGDILLISKNNYYWSRDLKEIDFLANGDIGRVTRVIRHENLYGFRFADVLLYFPDYEIEIECKIILDALLSDTPALSPEMSNQLYLNVLEDYESIPNKREKVKRLKENPFFNALQVKYGYSLTCHKAQGGQWKNVFLDFGYLTPEMIGQDFYRWLYTGITRSNGTLYFINLDKKFKEDKDGQS